jgi:RpiB/LacA/LacB family sugar-phosphate isomerase
MKGEADLGVLVCGTGLGMSMAANRHPGIRAALCHDHFTASASRRHNDANVLVMGGRVIGPDLAKEIVDTWLDTPFEGGRHLARVERIDK